MSKQVKADLILVLVTMCWGVSYYLMDISLAELDPFTLNAHRFLGAFVIAGIFSWKKVQLSASNILLFPIPDSFAR